MREILRSFRTLKRISWRLNFLVTIFFASTSSSSTAEHCAYMQNTRMYNSYGHSYGNVLEAHTNNINLQNPAKKEEEEEERVTTETMQRKKNGIDAGYFND